MPDDRRGFAALLQPPSDAQSDPLVSRPTLKGLSVTCRSNCGALAGIIDAIRELPLAERLDAAMMALEEIAGGDGHELAWLMDSYGLSPSEARMLRALHLCAGRVLSRGSLILAAGSEASENMVDSVIYHIRQRSGVEIRNVRGVGYMLERPLELGRVPPKVHFRERHALPWTTDDLAELRRMWANGSCVTAIAEELARTERGVLDKVKKLGLRK